MAARKYGKFNGILYCLSNVGSHKASGFTYGVIKTAKAQTGEQKQKIRR